MKIIDILYNLLWGDLLTIPLPNGGSLGISLLVMILIPLGIFFTIRTKFLPIRLFPEMLKISGERNSGKKNGSVSGLQTLMVSTATRVGMGNMIGVVAAISAGGAGAVFWMWITALMGASTCFVESTLAQLHKEKDPLYGGYRGSPAWYMHQLFGKGKRYNILAIFFSVSSLICYCGISQVTSNSVSSAFYNAYKIPPIVSTIILVTLAAIIVLRKNATIKVLDILVPVMAVFYFALAIIVIVKNIGLLPTVFSNIFKEAFGIRQVVAGGFGAVIMNGVKRGLFSNEAGAGTAPCAAAAADVSHPAKAGLFQAFGVIIDTLLICTCTAMLMLLAPEELISGLEGMELLQTAMNHHFGSIGVVFTAIALWLFSFSTFIGILFYVRPSIAYLFGDKWCWQTAYKILALIMLFIGGLAAPAFVWNISDIGVGLMTVFNAIAIVPLSGQAIKALNDYTNTRKKKR